MSTKSSISAVARLGGLALFALLAARPALAGDQVPGDSETTPTAGTRVLSEPNVQPGPIASHLIYLGESRDAAIADADRQGESPRVAQAEPAQPMLTSLQRYQEDVLGATPLDTRSLRRGRALAAAATRS